MVTRKQFLFSMLGIGAGAFVMACKKGDDEGTADAAQGPADAPRSTVDGSTTDGQSACGSTTTSISANHGHAVAIPVADIEAGVTKTYDITGSSDHDHSITVTAAMFTTLKGGTMIRVTSFGGNHPHDVTVTCA
ncbi:MAG: hypothetical protein WKG01_32520 [Kofleriaceae bacterium]